MNNIRKRQVHLDFHTNGTLPLGDDFSKEQFGAALKTGHVNSITLFSKCHHGYSYHPTAVNKIHPNLKFDLLGSQLEVCKELDINAPIYISAGLDEKDYNEHPEWVNVFWDDPEKQESFLKEVRFHALCFNTPYLEKLCAEIEEVMQMYDPCGIFLDIVWLKTCYCDCCKKSMKELGLDINSKEDRDKHSQIVLKKYFEATNAAVRKYSKTATIFHNAGHISKGDHEKMNYNTHLELESLPTGGYGYDHFPLSAAYVRTTGMEFLGMTGKFHNAWGEFGGFKHPNALIYETALSVANGGGCSIGDQMHPLGEMNMSTYELIGKAYSRIEALEPWLNGAENIADIAVLSSEAVCASRDATDPECGANRMLLESNYLYNVIDEEADFGKYKMLVLPDIGPLCDKTVNKIREYAANGGKIIASGDSLLKDGKFIVDIGCEYLGKSEYNPTYLVPEFETVDGVTAYVIKSSFRKIKAVDCEIMGYCENPYFNRTFEHFCSHQHTPNVPNSDEPAIVVKNNIAYVGWDIFSGYATEGHLIFKEIFKAMAEKLIGKEKTVFTSLPDRGVVTLTKQENKNILHLLFAYTTVRGKRTEVIEDCVPLYDIECAVRTPSQPKSVRAVPSGESLDFEYSEGKVKFTVPELFIHQAIEIAY